jgi:hypothetical protein
MKKHYIWQNTDLKIDDWRDGYIEFCEINNITPGGDDDLYDWMIDTNFNYLDDEYYNLNSTIAEQILLIADIGRWNGRVDGYKILKTRNLNEILNITDDQFEIYGDGKNIRATGAHHDGVNYYLYRAIRSDRNIENLLNAIYNGETITPAKLNYYTRSIYPDVAAVYGW